MAHAIRIRNLARSLDISEDELLLWLLDHEPALGDPHPADFLPKEIEARVRKALTKPAKPVKPAEPVERRCTDCMAAPAPSNGMRVVPTDSGVVCDRCHGSVNKREALGLIDAFTEHGLRRLLVVGGGPGTAEELRTLLGEAIQLRIVDGESYRDATQAEAELAWADVVAIWASTILPHKVSKLYTDRRAEYREKLVTVPRRGAAAFCKVIADKVRSAPGAPRVKAPQGRS